MLRPCGLVVRRATCCNRRPFRCLLIAGVLADLYGGAYQDVCWHKGQNILLVVAGVKIDTSHNVHFGLDFAYINGPLQLSRTSYNNPISSIDRLPL